MNIDVLQKRIRLPELRNKVTSAEAAAEHVKDGDRRHERFHPGMGALKVFLMP